MGRKTKFPRIVDLTLMNVPPVSCKTHLAETAHTRAALVPFVYRSHCDRSVYCPVQVCCLLALHVRQHIHVAVDNAAEFQRPW